MMLSMSLSFQLRQGSREEADILLCHWYLHCLHTSETHCKTIPYGGATERTFYDHLSWMVLHNAKVRISGYAILENTSLWQKWRPNNGITSPDYVGIIKMSRGRQWFFKSLAVQIFGVELKSVKVNTQQKPSRTDQTRRNLYSPGNGEQGLWKLWGLPKLSSFSYLMVHISVQLINTALELEPPSALWCTNTKHVPSVAQNMHQNCRKSCSHTNPSAFRLLWEMTQV